MKFNVEDILRSAIGYKGLPYPMGFVPDLPPKYTAGKYNYPGAEHKVKIYSDKGSVLRRQDAMGRWYFMPVTLNSHELPNAVISVSGSKTIVETAMVGRKGTVKELISVDDYEINIVAVALDTDFPEREITALNDLFNVNKSIPLQSALTDIFLEEDDLVVIRSMDLSEMRGMETSQIVKFNLVTDKNFELILG